MWHDLRIIANDVLARAIPTKAANGETFAIKLPLLSDLFHFHTRKYMQEDESLQKRRDWHVWSFPDNDGLPELCAMLGTH